jgi:ATP-dependent 26S proteasome regulatory subunit
MTLHVAHGQPQIELLAQRSIKDAYSSVGGLNKQIEEIRDLLEIPLTRPELFRYFGKWSLLQKHYIFILLTRP